MRQRENVTDDSRLVELWRMLHCLMAPTVSIVTPVIVVDQGERRNRAGVG